VDDVIVDTFAMRLVREPQNFDVVVTTNMFGDILSDEAAGLVGGLGMAPGLCIGDGDVAMAQATHGSAPDIAGRGIANPYAMIESSRMLFEWLGHSPRQRRRATHGGVYVAGDDGGARRRGCAHRRHPWQRQHRDVHAGRAALSEELTPIAAYACLVSAAALSRDRPDTGARRADGLPPARGLGRDVIQVQMPEHMRGDDTLGGQDGSDYQYIPPQQALDHSEPEATEGIATLKRLIAARRCGGRELPPRREAPPRHRLRNRVCDNRGLSTPASRASARRAARRAPRLRPDCARHGRV